MERTEYPVFSLTSELKAISGSFRPNGSSAVTATTRVGKGYTVARTSAGVFTVTLADKYPRIVGGVAHLRMAGSHPYKVNVGTVVSGSSTNTALLEVVSMEPLQFTKAADGAAGTTTAETMIGRVSAAMPIGHMLYINPAAALTADDTNYATITVSKRTAGASKTTVATAVTNVAGTGSWTAWSPVGFALTAAVSAADTLQIEVAKAASGVQLPALTLTATGLMDIPSDALNRIDFTLFFQNTSNDP